MISLKSIICFMTLCYFSHSLENALFFDFKSQSLVEMGKFDETAKCKSCLSACPVSKSKKEELLNYSVSVTGNVIFLKQVYSNPTTASEMNIEICENALRPGLVWNIEDMSFDVGYEMYYEQGQIKLKSSYDNYIKVINGKPSVDPKKVPSEDEIKIHRTDKGTEFEVVDQPEKKFAFYFINVLAIDLFNDDKTRSVSFIRDTINDYRHEIQTIFYCKTYFSGDVTQVIDEKQKIDVPAQIFENDSQSDNGTLAEELETNTERPEDTADRLVKTQILPMRMYHTLAARLATCMYLNIAFVWESIAKTQLKKVDLFLYALYRVYPSDIDMIFGVSGASRQVERLNRERIDSEDRLFTQFPVPKMMFRFINITVGKNYYGAAVVIHNNVESVQDAERICKVEEEVEGWNDISSTNDAPGLTYTCAQTPEVLKKLGFEGNTQLNPIPLELDYFPYKQVKYSSIDLIEYKGILNEINNELNNIKELHIEY